MQTGAAGSYMELFRKTVGAAGSGRVNVVLHGLFGSHRNWQSVAKALAERLGEQVVTVDLRNHGCSVQFGSDGRPKGMEMTWCALAADIAETLRAIRRPVCLVGHSLGGQVAMQSLLAQRLGGASGQGPVERLVVVDIAPMPYRFLDTPQHRYLRAMQQVEALGLSSRAKAMDAFRGAHTDADEQIVQFLFTNYGKQPASDRSGFLVPLPALEQGMLEMSESFAESIRGRDAAQLPTLFVRGGRSEYVGAVGEAAIGRHFAQYEMATLRDCGHWPHHDDPGLFVDTVARFLAKKRH